MRPGDSAWAEAAGTFGLIALAFLLAFANALRKALRDRRQERAALRLLRDTVPPARVTALTPRGCPFVGCTDPMCPNRLVSGDVRRGA